MLNLVLFFIVGTIMGSFYTVVGLRLPKHEDFVFDRSHCDHCNHPLHLFDMIPILSYLFYGGRCKYCHQKVDVLYPIMEFFTGVLFALAYFCFSGSYEIYELFIALGIISLLMIVVVSDITYLIIPDEILVFFTFYFLFLQFLHLGWQAVVVHVITGIFLFSITLMPEIFLYFSFNFKYAL